MKTIGIIDPSYTVNDEQKLKIKSFFEKNNFKVIFCNITENLDEKVKNIHEIYSNKNIDIIFALTGGRGCIEIVDKIDYNIIKSNPKPLFGFSDITALHNSIIKNLNIVSYYALNAKSFIKSETTNNISMEYCLNFIKNIDNTINLKKLTKNIKVLKEGKANGKSIGGNITLLEDGLFTNNDVSFDNKILFIEDTDTDILDIYHKLLHIERVGKFNKIKGVVGGEFRKISNQDKIDLSLDKVLLKIFDKYNIPIISNFPFGHRKNKMVIPLNMETNIDTNRKKFNIVEFKKNCL